MGKIRIIIFLLALLQIFLLSLIVFFPYPELFVYPYLANNGLTPYKEILDQHFPGLMFLESNLSSIGIVSVHTMRLLHLFLAGLTNILISFGVLAVTKNKFATLFASLTFLIWQITFEGYVLWIESFMAPLIVVSLALLLRIKEDGKLLNYALSGLLLGISLIFKQIMVPFLIIVFLYLLLSKTEIKKLIIFALFACLPGITMVVWAYRSGIWSDFWFWTVEFNLTTFSEMGRKYITLKELLKFMAILAPSFLLLFDRLIMKKAERDKGFLFLSFFVGSSLFAYARFDFIHLLPFVAIYSFYLGFECSKSGLLKKLLILSMTGFGIVYLSFFVFKYRSEKVLFFTDREMDVARAVIKYKGDSDKVFALGSSPHIYYLTDTTPSGNLFVFQFPWFMKHAQERVLKAIESDPPSVVVYDETAEVDGYKLIDYMKDIEEYVLDNYEIAEVHGSSKILIKK